MKSFSYKIHKLIKSLLYDNQLTLSYEIMQISILLPFTFGESSNTLREWLATGNYSTPVTKEMADYILILYLVSEHPRVPVLIKKSFL